MHMPTKYIADAGSDFQNLVFFLQRPHGDYACVSANPITYNPEKETITLTGHPKSKVEKAMKKLQKLVEDFSQRWGAKYLVKTQDSTSRALMLNCSNARSSANSATAKIFPINPKEHWRLVQLWSKSILPALQQILTDRLGGTYAANLVRRGDHIRTAKPCIQIESPCLPAPAAQRIIKSSVDEICVKDEHQSIQMYFTKGSVQRLNGGEAEDENDAGNSADLQELELNYARPYSKPGMGASVGLLCSKGVSATLGGYVLIGDDKYLLTSDHFVEKSREEANRDSTTRDRDTLTSPSRYDLEKIERNLKQTVRDVDGQINKLMRECYGNNNIPQEEFSDLTSNLDELERSKNDAMSLIDQVTRPLAEYAVGTVTRRSLENWTETVSMPLANDMGLPENRPIVHHMDWALCDANTQMAQNGENRHKYRSEKEAMEDRYIDERDHANYPGEICHETCRPQSGLNVYYVGQGSRHRSGKVHLPTLVSVNRSKISAWGISDGHGMLFSEVAGDSGAWVIRKDGNKLMGQVHSFSLGQVLFTPIDAIFAHLKEACDSDVSLPPCPFDPGQILPIRPLCSEPLPPTIRAYSHLKPPPMVSATPLRVQTFLPKTKPNESSIYVPSLIDAESAHDQKSSNTSHDSLPSLPSLTASPQSIVTTPEHLQSPQSPGVTYGQVTFEKLPSKSSPTVVSESTMSDIPDLSLDKQHEDQLVELGHLAFQFKDQSPLQIVSSTRTPNRPIEFGNRVTKAQRGSESFQPDRAMPFSARSILDRLAQVACRIGKAKKAFGPLGLTIL